jgi:hypothetical protein
MVGVDITSLNMPIMQTKYGLQTADTVAARDTNLRILLGAGFSHLQSHYISEWVIQTTNYPAGRTTHTYNTPKIKDSPFINDDFVQVSNDLNVAVANAPKQWKAK